MISKCFLGKDHITQKRRKNLNHLCGQNQTPNEAELKQFLFICIHDSNDGNIKLMTDRPSQIRGSTTVFRSIL